MKQTSLIALLIIILLLGIGCEKQEKKIEIVRNYDVEDVTGKAKEPEPTSQVQSTISQTEPVVNTSNISLETSNLKPDLNLKNLLPDLKNHPDFKLTKEPEFFIGKDLYEYIDGGAELYHSYNFRQIITAEYQSQSNPDLSIIIDIYDMSTPDNAFGVFSVQKDSSSNFINIGIQGISGGGEIVFIKDKYFVKITTFVDTKESNDVLRKFALEAADRIKGTDSLPKIFKIFPKEGKIKNSEGFVLMNAFACPDFNNVFTANYEVNNERIQIAISDRQSTRDGKNTFEKIKDFFTSNEPSGVKIGEDSFITKNKNGESMLVAMKNEKIVCAIGYKEFNNAKSLIEQILSRI